MSAVLFLRKLKRVRYFDRLLHFISSEQIGLGRLHEISGHLWLIDVPIRFGTSGNCSLLSLGLRGRSCVFTEGRDDVQEKNQAARLIGRCAATKSTEQSKESRRKGVFGKEHDTKESPPRSRVIAAFASVVVLIATTAILAQLTPNKDLVAHSNKQAEQATAPVPGNLTPANLSKEYVYGPGGRLVASEEPNAIAPTLMSFAGIGGTGSVSVSVAAGTGWSANSTANWITVTSGAYGTGNGTVGYLVSTNTTTSIRQGTITIATQTFTVYQGKDFADVPVTNPYYTYIGKLAARGVTLGCDATKYCPNSLVTREQMAAFIIRALGDFDPPTPQAQRFLDVPPSNLFYNNIEQMAVRQITVGCGGGNYCPSANVLHEQMSAFIMRALAVFSPPTPASQMFPDVAPSNIFYNFIDVYAGRGIWKGGGESWVGHPEGTCSSSNFCPSKSVSRAQMAKILVTAFNL